MKKFILKTIFSVLVPLILILFFWILKYGFPLPNFSNNISFNAMIHNIRHNHINDSIDVLAVGSSMTLNNVDSNTIVKYLGKNYLNASAWGNNIEEDFNLLTTFLPFYDIKYLIISSYYGDFHGGDVDLLSEQRFKKIRFFLKTGISPLEDFLNIKYILQKTREYNNFKKNIYDYTSLNYDPYGGVLLPKQNFKISQNRWNGEDIVNTSIKLRQYDFLYEISKLCAKKEIILIFVNNPIRKGFYETRDNIELNILQVHSEKVFKILNEDKHIFIDTQNILWDDDLFVDYAHLNNEGAKKYTEYFISRLF